MKHLIYALSAVLLLVSCKTEAPKKDVLFELIPADQSNIDFTNTLEEDARLNILSFEYFYNGAGVGVGDFNNDSLPDLFFNSNMGASKLYLNKGNFKFEDITASSGIDTRGKWAAGVSIVDINQDGWADVYICFAGPHDAAKRANALYINDEKNHFTDQADAYGLADSGHSVQAAFFDYDRDGDLDCYILTNTTDELGPNIIRPKRMKGEMINTDRLYQNDGKGHFTNVSAQAGILAEGYGLGLSIIDINQDGWPDIFVSNDYLSNDLLYINNKDSSFTDQSAAAFKHTSYSAMGNDAGDINNDALPDLIEVDMLPPDNFRRKLMLGNTNHDRYRSEIQMGYAPQFMRNSLQLNQGLNEKGIPQFSEIGQLAGLSATDWSWSALMVDIDNDGWKDVFISNGYPRDITNRDFITYQAQGLARKHASEPLSDEQFAKLKQLEGAYLPNLLYRNNQQLGFTNEAANWGLDDIAYSTGAAYADLDNDGDQDLIVLNTGKPVGVYRNKLNEKQPANFLRVQLNGKEGNREAFGAAITLYAGNMKQYQQHQVVRGYQSSMDQRILFGLGSANTIDSLLITWPDGQVERRLNIAVNQTIRLNYSDSKPAIATPVNHENQFLFALKQSNGLAYTHKETPYTDFNIQPLLPHKLSMGGPGMAAADVNGDGLEDIFIGGAYKQSGEILLQQSNGNFTHQNLDTGKKNEEDMGALFFDADQDGDLDLYVVSGGNEFADQSVYYQDRLYINDGKGRFTIARNALPAARFSGSCVVAADIDRDGDLDLFVGGRVRPQHYPEAGVSQLLINEGGRFIDKTDALAPGLAGIGMVTAAIWSDYNQDGFSDLLVVGEWMPLTVFTNKAGRLENSTAALGLTNTVGWWNSIQGGDLDQDGRTDYVLGNHGSNTRYTLPGEGNPGMYTHDFAGTGTRQAVISYTANGKQYPIHPRDDLFQQLPVLRKKFPLYADYAKASMQELFAPAVLEKAVYTELNEVRSSVVLNKSSGNWSLSPLPIKAQFAPVFGTLVKDVNQEGIADILLIGNDYNLEVINGPADALNGLCLLGKKGGGFTPVAAGFNVPGDGKSLIELSVGKNQTYLLAAQNNADLKVFQQQRVKNSKRISVGTQDAYAEIVLQDGSQHRIEIYYGSGYLSASSRSIEVPATTKELTLTDFRGTKRKLAITY